MLYIKTVFHPGLAHEGRPLRMVLEGLSLCIRIPSLQALPAERRPLKPMRWAGSGEGAERKPPTPATLAPRASSAFLRALRSPT